MTSSCRPLKWRNRVEVSPSPFSSIPPALFSLLLRRASEGILRHLWSRILRASRAPKIIRG
ncbi:hypothetical protein Taro_028310 [Colocasia esculenta]|uniref:Uncharacterized protein n=1 Tax=Colocasia esculenta TaxID=4460 RepID=A0A843VG74_COLES|nr:hypothetical protein [Colocasia esculenta]